MRKHIKLRGTSQVYLCGKSLAVRCPLILQSNAIDLLVSWTFVFVVVLHPLRQRENIGLQFFFFCIWSIDATCHMNEFNYMKNSRRLSSSFFLLLFFASTSTRLNINVITRGSRRKREINFLHRQLLCCCCGRSPQGSLVVRFAHEEWCQLSDTHRMLREHPFLRKLLIVIDLT